MTQGGGSLTSPLAGAAICYVLWSMAKAVLWLVNGVWHDMQEGHALSGT